ncbi:putative manganese transporter [Hathewaya histolytica]|uniref:putative manganese transporter n=1 Tax=Hathewaya histolytica TaxID=1498 RepID=UPI003B671E21
MHILIHSFLHGIEDTLKMLPLLFIVLFLMEFLEIKYGKTLNDNIKKAGKLGPLIGSLLGVIPQCGISILAVGFFSERLISLGTMMAVFISTSDEAIPLLISNPKQAKTILPLILTKLVLGIIVGYSVDFIFKNHNINIKNIKNLNLDNHCFCSHDESSHIHNHDNKHNKDLHIREHDHINLKHIFIHTLKKLFKIALYIFVVTFLLNIILEMKELSSILKISSGNTIIQIFFSSLIGLIPNCATSIALVEVFSIGSLSYSALISGLSSNAGLALILLFKERQNRKSALLITLILYVSAVICGLLTNLIF